MMDTHNPNPSIHYFMTYLTKSVVEEAALAWLEALGYAVLKRQLQEAIGPLSPI